MTEIKVGQIYKHFKGNIYKVIAIAKHSENEEEMIVYQSQKHGDIWVRPKRMWLEKVDNNNTLRFNLIEDI